MAITSVGEVLMQLFRSEGVEYIFGLPGLTEVRFIDVLEDHPEIKYVMGLHESVCVGMAEGYARASGKVGVVNLHTINGIASAMGLLSNAYTGGVPLLITAGQQDSRLFAQEPRLWGDLVRMASQFTKWSTEITSAEDIPRIIQRAFKTALQPPTGPVFVSLPQNLFEQNINFDFAPNTPHFPQLRPDMNALTIACELINAAQNPAIMVGPGIAKYNALSEVVELAELIGAPVFEWWMSDVNYPVQHPQYLGDLLGQPKLIKMVKSADVLIVIGAPPYIAAFYSPEPPFPKTTRIIQIDDNPNEIGKNIPVASGVQGNIKLSVAELIDILQNKMSNQEHQKAKSLAEHVYEQKALLDKSFFQKSEQERENMPISVSRLMQELRDALKPGTIVVDDCWSSSFTLRRTLNLSEPGSYLRAREGGSIGWGISAALGVKLAVPDRPVVAVSGDGSAIWNIQSLWTAAHYNIPIINVICCNACYGQVKLSKAMILGDKAKGRSLGENLDNPRIDFCQIAKSVGIDGKKVVRPDELGDALTSAIESNRPGLIEVYIETKL